MRTKRPRNTPHTSSPPSPLSVPEKGNDGRMWPLLQRYCKLAKAKLIARGADLYELKLPLAERAHFGDRATVRVALSLEALERDPDAEMAVLGSPFLAHLLEAIRTRAGRLSLGMIPGASPKLGRQPSALSRQQPLADGRPLMADGRSTGMPVSVRHATARRRKSA